MYSNDFLRKKIFQSVKQASDNLWSTNDEIISVKLRRTLENRSNKNVH